MSPDPCAAWKAEAAELLRADPYKATDSWSLIGAGLVTVSCRLYVKFTAVVSSTDKIK